MKILSILSTDKDFKSNISVAAIVAVSLIGIHYYNSLDERIAAIEGRINGKVEVELEKDYEWKTPTKKATNSFSSQTSRLYNTGHKLLLTNQDINCLVKNIYHEARFEPYIGKLAVAQVTFNRVLDGRWGDTICKVVYAKKQFSWTLKRKLRNKSIPDSKRKAMLHVVDRFQHGVRVADLNDAKWYHANYVHPRWKSDYKKINQYGLHIFYKERGPNNRYTESQLIADSHSE